MAVVGDRVLVSSTKVGEASRDGVVTGVTGSVDGRRVHFRALDGFAHVVGKQSGSGGRKQKTKSASVAKGPVRR